MTDCHPISLDTTSVGAPSPQAIAWGQPSGEVVATGHPTELSHGRSSAWQFCFSAWPRYAVIQAWMPRRHPSRARRPCHVADVVVVDYNSTQISCTNNVKHQCKLLITDVSRICEVAHVTITGSGEIRKDELLYFCFYVLYVTNGSISWQHHQAKSVDANSPCHRSVMAILFE
uniref:Uncharacterized protein n=1 Tax=Panagrellus redivivus TaxID=6233 RepID=A0A7E4VMD5_PANRE